MIYHVQFPALGIELDVNRVAFTIGGMNIYWYGIMIALGLGLALCFAFLKAKSFGIDSDRFVDVVMVGTVISVACARAFYVAMAPFEYESVWDMINMRDGGIAIYGAVIGAFGSAYFLAKWRRLKLLPLCDLVSVCFLIGQGIGRWGNFFNQEAFGTNTNLPWGMYSEGTNEFLKLAIVTAPNGVSIDPTAPVHPTFLYESIWCLLGFLLLWAYMKHRKFDGEIFLMYIVWYGLERCVVEGLRTDSLMIGGVRVSQMIAVLSVVVGLALLIYLRRKNKDKALVVHYTFTGKGVPEGAEMSWLLGETPPTDAQLKKQREIAINLKKQLDSGAKPVGVWN